MAHTEQGNMSGDQALEKLLDGNRRYVDAMQEYPNQTRERRNELKNGQVPFAVVLGCSDSRVPPEIIFDQGLGDLFVVRVAGNVMDNMALGSIEYAVSHLKTPLVVVLGHSQCGAVTETLSSHGPAKGQMGRLAEAIQPAVAQVTDQPGNKVSNTAKVNAKMVAHRLRTSKPILSEAVAAGELTVAAAYYELSTGAVELLDS